MSQIDLKPNVTEFTVTELAHSLKHTIEESYAYVRLRGEVSGYRGPHSSGHVYFSLKDAGAKIDAVVWKGVFGRLKFKPEEGLEVIATGKLSTFPGSSKYQIIIEQLEPSGLGALMALLEERRKKLSKEGLFDLERKKNLPRMPQVIGVITSPTGAVIRDILHRVSDRFPVHVLVWPVRVQGETSADEIAAAIKGFNEKQDNFPTPDLLIVARGGGSLEDLWSFNEERVVRAVAESNIPLISAVGHETDWTLIDMAADVRAPTPTAAAELAVPVRQDLLAQILQQGERLFLSLRQHQLRMKQQLAALVRAFPRAESLLALPRQKLDYAQEGLVRALQALVQVKRVKLLKLSRGLSLPLLSQKLNYHLQNLEASQKRLQHALDVRVAKMNERITARAQLLSSLSYRRILARGYTVIRDELGQIVQSKSALATTKLSIEFSDGQVSALLQQSAKIQKSQSDLFDEE